MKKITSIALVLVLALLLPCFAACDGADASTTPTESTVTTPGTDPAPNAETTADPDAQVTTPDGTCRHAKMGEWVSTGEYTCTGLAISTRACKHCDFIQYDYIEDFSGTVGNHVLGEEVLASYPGASNLPGFELRTCSFCQENVRVETAATNTRKNLLVVTPAMIEAAGLGTVNDYLKSEHGTHIHKNKSGSSDWGHIGYTGAHGTGTIYDSFREAEITTNNSVMYWNLKDIDNRYTPNGVLVADGSDETAKYCALIGIDFYSKTTVSGFGVFVENQNEFAFDILGGTKNADGTTSWKVLGSSSGTYNPYNDTTSFTLGDFEAAEVDCIQIGITTSLAQVVVISEIEIYG